MTGRSILLVAAAASLVLAGCGVSTQDSVVSPATEACQSIATVASGSTLILQSGCAEVISGTVTDVEINSPTGMSISAANPGAGQCTLIGAAITSPSATESAMEMVARPGSPLIMTDGPSSLSAASIANCSFETYVPPQSPTPTPTPTQSYPHLYDPFASPAS